MKCGNQINIFLHLFCFFQPWVLCIMYEYMATQQIQMNFQIYLNVRSHKINCLYHFDRTLSEWMLIFHCNYFSFFCCLLLVRKWFLFNRTKMWVQYDINVSISIWNLSTEIFLLNANNVRHENALSLMLENERDDS